MNQGEKTGLQHESLNRINFRTKGRSVIMTLLLQNGGFISNKRAPSFLCVSCAFSFQRCQTLPKWKTIFEALASTLPLFLSKTNFFYLGHCKVVLLSMSLFWRVFYLILFLYCHWSRSVLSLQCHWIVFHQGGGLVVVWAAWSPWDGSQSGGLTVIGGGGTTFK